jgi:hypothetical protein
MACSAGTGDSSLRAHRSGGVWGGRGNDRHGCWVCLAIGYRWCVHPASSRARLRMCLSSTAIFPWYGRTPQRGREFSLGCLHQSLPGHAVAFDMIDGCLLVVSELATTGVTAGRTVISITGRFTVNMFGSTRATTAPARHDRLRQGCMAGDWQSLISGHVRGYGPIRPQAGLGGSGDPVRARVRRCRL